MAYSANSPAATEASEEDDGGAFAGGTMPATKTTFKIQKGFVIPTVAAAAYTHYTSPVEEESQLYEDYEDEDADYVADEPQYDDDDRLPRQQNRRVGQPRKPSKDELWESRFAQLEEYKAEQGHTHVSIADAKYHSLAVWVKNQRQWYNKGTLRADRVSRLDSIDFMWVVPRGKKATATYPIKRFYQEDEDEEGEGAGEDDDGESHSPAAVRPRYTVQPPQQHRQYQPPPAPPLQQQQPQPLQRVLVDDGCVKKSHFFRSWLFGDVEEACAYLPSLKQVFAYLPAPENS